MKVLSILTGPSGAAVLEGENRGGVGPAEELLDAGGDSSKWEVRRRGGGREWGGRVGGRSGAGDAPMG